MELTKTERLILINQYRILARLYPEEEDDCETSIQILANGYKYNYKSLIEYIDDDLSEEISEEVFDILQMYRSLHGSYKQLEDKTGIDKDKVMFQGFDGNEETEHYDYAYFLIKDFDRYEEFRNQDLNTHYQILDKYRNMLRVWSKYGRYATLDKNQILEVLNAK